MRREFETPDLGELAKRASDLERLHGGVGHVRVNSALGGSPVIEAQRGLGQRWPIPLIALVHGGGFERRHYLLCDLDGIEPRRRPYTGPLAVRDECKKVDPVPGVRWIQLESPSVSVHGRFEGSLCVSGSLVTSVKIDLFVCPPQQAYRLHELRIRVWQTPDQWLEQINRSGRLAGLDEVLSVKAPVPGILWIEAADCFGQLAHQLVPADIPQLFHQCLVRL